MPAITRRMLLPLIAALPVAIGSKALYALAVRPKNGLADQENAVSLAAFGGGPSVLDNSRAMRAAIAALSERGGGVLNIGAGVHRFASEALGHAGLRLPSNVTIRGAGRAGTRLQVTGGAACNMFVALDQSGIAIEDLAIIGNGVASSGSSDGSAAAISWMLTAAAKANLADFSVRRVHLENFRGPYWLDVQNIGDGTRRLEMRSIALRDISFASRPGNSINPGDVQFNSAAVCINGFGGAIRDVQVSNLVGDARHIKTGLILYHQVVGARLEDLRIANAGREGATDDAGAYGIQIYDTFYRMYSIEIVNPVITNARSVGIYAAGATGVTIRNAAISGQTDRRSGTLLKGAIAFGGTRRWRVEGATLRNNWRDIDIVTPAERIQGAPPEPNGRINDVTATGSETGISLYRSDERGTSGVSITNCRWQTRAQTVLLRGSQRQATPANTTGADEAILLDNCQLAASDGFRAVEIGVDPGLSGTAITLTHCTLSGSNPLYAKGHIGPVKVEDCLVRDLGTTAGAAAAALIDCPKLDLRNSRFQSPGKDGVGLNLSGSTGSLRGLQFPGSARPLSPVRTRPQLGSGKPTFGCVKGQYVQNLEPRPGDFRGWTCAGGTRWNGVDPVSE